MIICMVSTESLRVEQAGCILMPFDYTMQSSVICAHIPHEDRAIAQLVRFPGVEAAARGFNPWLGRTCAPHRGFFP